MKLPGTAPIAAGVGGGGMQQASKRVFGLLITEGRHRGSVLQDGRLFVHQKTEKTTGEQDSLEIRFPRSYLPSQQGLRSAARSSMPWGGM